MLTGVLIGGQPSPCLEKSHAQLIRTTAGQPAVFRLQLALLGLTLVSMGVIKKWVGDCLHANAKFRLPCLFESKNEVVIYSSLVKATSDLKQLLSQPEEDLLLSRSQDLKAIRDCFNAEFADGVIYYTCYSIHISSYVSEDYQMVFEVSPFGNIQSQPILQSQLPFQIEKALQQRLPGYSQFFNNNVLGFLKDSTSPTTTIS